jgi:hypothetical protein
LGQGRRQLRTYPKEVGRQQEAEPQVQWWGISKSLVHAPLICQISLIKHTLKDEITKHFKTALSPKCEALLPARPYPATLIADTESCP